jgi:hypothetical protein
VYGRSDRIGAYVTDGPVSPQDLLATVYHLCGVSGDATFADRQGRVLPLYGDGTPIRHILT